MTYRSARLEAIFGVPLDRLDAAAVRGLVGTEAAEATDLDFKRELYGTSDGDRRALATDVAALANTSGGVVLLGVTEDDQARAADTPGVALSDDEQRRMMQIVAGNVAPVPRFEVRPLPDADDPANGFYAIMVERTPAAPHAVVVGDNLRFPRRNGTTTRYLTEPEVAQAYTARLGALADQQASLDEVWKRGAGGLTTTEHTWVAVAAVPEVRGALRLDQAAFRAFEQKSMAERPLIVDMGFSTQRAFVSRGHFTADGANAGEALSKWFRRDAYADGSTFFAIVCGWDRAQPGATVIDDEHLVVGVLSALSVAARQAEATGASGSLWLRASVLPVTPDRPVELGHSRDQFGRGSWNRGARTAVEAIDGVTEVDAVAAGGGRLVAAGAALCDGIMQTMGLAECGQITAGGQIRLPYISHQLRPRLLPWAEAAGVEVVKDDMTQ